jgi:plastocyanin
MMKLSLPILLALVGLSACDATASNQPATVVVTLTPSTANATCVVANPDPANIRSGQTIAFHNSTSMSHTVIADGLDTPWTVVAPGETSGSIRLTVASTRKYYVQGCGSASPNLHTVIVTVN